MSMNPEIKAQWTAALRSGEYQQGKGQLRRGDKLCCLGVLCELAVKAGLIAAPTGTDIEGDVQYGAEKGTLILPEEVQEWAGLDTPGPEVDRDKLPEGAEWQEEPEPGVATPSLTSLNDGGTPFAVIADIIDQQL